MPGKSGLERLEDRAFHAIPQVRDIEVDQEPESLSRKAQIGEKLRVVDRPEGIDALDFDDQAVPDQEIESIRAIEPDPAVLHDQRDLSPERQAGQCEFTAQARLVRALQEAWPESAVDAHGASDDFPRPIGFDNPTTSSVTSAASVTSVFRDPGAFLRWRSHGYDQRLAEQSADIAPR